MVEVDVVEREHESLELVRHWTGDGAERQRRGRREWEHEKPSGPLLGLIVMSH
jgi:hypothetical protein